MLNNLQLYRGQWFEGLTDQNLLSTAFLTQPELVTNVIQSVFGMSRNNPILSLTNTRKKEISNREYEWMLRGDNTKAITIVSNFSDGGATPGIAHTTFRVTLAEKWFGKNDILITDDRDYQVRVTTDPYPDGSGHWVYTLALDSADDTSFIPAALIASGKRLSKGWTAVAEMDEGGNTTFSTPFKMRNHLTTLRKNYSITRSAATDLLIIAMKDPESGKTSYLWTDYMEWEAMSQFYAEIEKSLWYSRYSLDPTSSTNPVRSDNGRPIYQGAGIREQIAPANKREYTTLTEDILRNFIFDLSYNITPESTREFVAFTGEMGFAEFHKAMERSAAGFTLVDSKRIQGQGQSLIFGGQFIEYHGLNGTKFKLIHNPLYDNVVDNRQVHYQTGHPIESYRYTILDYGTHGGESNIQKVYKKDSEMLMWSVNGSITPGNVTAKSIQTQRSSGQDGYTVHFLTECGIRINNPMACGELICTAVAS